MTFKDDITARIQTDFAENASMATSMLIDAIIKTDYLRSDRIIRCILFLANGDLNNLTEYIEVAILDPRDIILLAEYERFNNDINVKRLRDFNHTFEASTINVKE